LWRRRNAGQVNTKIAYLRGFIIKNGTISPLGKWGAKLEINYLNTNLEFRGQKEDRRWKIEDGE